MKGDFFAYFFVVKNNNQVPQSNFKHLGPLSALKRAMALINFSGAK
jgi:hypothetical protein